MFSIGDKMNNTIKLKDIFCEGFELFKKNAMLLIGIAFVSMIPTILQIIAGQLKIMTPLLILPLSLLALFCPFWGVFALLKATATLYSNQSTSVKEAYLSTINKIIPGIILALFLNLIILSGLLLFLIPGIVIATFFAFSTNFLILEDTTLKDSLILSKKLITGHFRNVCIVATLALLIGYGNLAIYLSNLPIIFENTLSLIVTLLTGPVIVCVSVVYFYKLKSQQPQDKKPETNNQLQEKPAQEKPEQKKGYSSCMGCFVLAVSLGILFSMLMLGVRGCGKFVATDEGKVYFEKVAQRFNPEINIDGIIQLKRPEYYLVTKSTKHMGFTAFDFRHNTHFNFSMFAYPFSLLKITPQDLDTFGAGSIFEKFLQHLYATNTYSKKLYSNLEETKLSPLLINKKQWVMHRGIEKNKFDPDKDITHVMMYTIIDDRVLFVSYELDHADGKLVPEWGDQEIIRILETASLINPTSP